MRLLVLTLISMIVCFGSVQAQSKYKSRYIKPAIYSKKLQTDVSGKKRTYYDLSYEKPTVINVKGPGKLRILTRVQFANNQTGTLDYDLFYQINGGEAKAVKFTDVEPSKQVKFAENKLGIPGIMQDFVIELDRGYHNIIIKQRKSTAKVYARFNFTPTKPKNRNWIAYSAVQPSELVDLVTRETISTYNRFSMESPLKIEVNGPTQLRILSRIENHYNMKGTINYRLQVKEKGKVINTYQLSSKHSEITVYKDDKELIPGIAREFVINVPKGTHMYEIYPLDKDKSTILGRCLIPKKDIGL